MQSPEPDDLAQLRAENALLKLRKENAQLLAETRALATPASPWWKNRATIVTLTAIVTAVVPLTTAVQGWMQKSRELAVEEVRSKAASALELQREANAAAIQRERQTEEIRSSYVERLKAPAEHLRALRFVLATTEDRPLRAWAMEEKNLVEDELQKQQDEARQTPETVPKVHKLLEPAARPPVTTSQPLAQDDKADAPQVVTSKLDDLKEQAAAVPKVRKTADIATKPQVDAAKMKEGNEQAREADNPLPKPKEWQRHYPGF
jgi:hypothetical protein